jgi:arabinogalactan oligomer / maltooligosaccharide transport system substrate-binding protein
MKKFLRCSSLVAMAIALASCGGGENNDSSLTEFDATFWVSETAGVADLTKQQIEKWNETNGKYKINATIEGISEKDSAAQMLTDVESGADVYCFAQDQMNRLITAQALNKLGAAASSFVSENNDSGAVQSAKVNGEIYAYPITADNTYFMMYDKRYIKEEHLNSLEDIVADCEATGKKFSMENETSAWYLASWFFGAGCKSNWTANSDGTFASVDDDFDSANGLIAMRGMQHLVKSDCYVSQSGASAFSDAIPSAVLISGTWSVNDAKEVLGDNLGYAKLPCYKVDGKEYQLTSYFGYKYMGVKPQKDATKSAALNQLVQYLSGEECQLERFNSFGWGPSNLKAAENDAVKSDGVMSAVTEQYKYSVTQGQIHGSWWDIAKVLGQNAKEAASDDTTALQAGLDTYKKAIDGLFSMSPEELRAFTVIGKLNGTNWGTDFAMTETEKGSNIWISDDAFTVSQADVDNGCSFKVRQGKSWDVAFGGNTEDNTDKDGNYVIKTPGTYKIKLTYNESNKTGVVELINQGA